MSKRIYLAAPYSHADNDVRAYRFSAVTWVAGELMRQGDVVYSPLTAGHVISTAVDLPSDWEFWRTSCLSYLEEWATALYVLRLAGWDMSTGVAAETDAARRLRLPIVHILPVRTPATLIKVYAWGEACPA